MFGKFSRFFVHACKIVCAWHDQCVPSVVTHTHTHTHTYTHTVYFVISKGARDKEAKGGAVDTPSKKDDQGGRRLAVPRRRSPGRKDKEDEKESNNANKKDN